MSTTTYTSGLRLTNQPNGGNATTWGDIADDNFEFIDDAITGLVTVDITGGSSITLTTGNGVVDQARHMGIVVAGIPSSANSVIIPASQKQYLVHTQHTSVAGGITFRTPSGTGVNLTTDKLAIIYCNGVSVYKVADVSPQVSALDPSNNLSEVANVSAARVNLGVLHASAVNYPIQVSSGILQIVSPLPVSAGGTGASAAANAFTNLKQDATTDATGVVELATSAEVATGTDTARVPSISTLVFHQGIAKAWGRFTASSGSPSVQDSYNISSITDNGTGRWQPNFSVAMANSSYSVSFTGKRAGGSEGSSNASGFGGLTAQSTGSFNFQTGTTGGSPEDYDIVVFTVWGDR